MTNSDSMFSGHKGPKRQEDETYEEYRARRKRENKELKEYRKGFYIEDGIGDNRKRYLMKKIDRGTIDEVSGL